VVNGDAKSVRPRFNRHSKFKPSIGSLGLALTGAFHRRKLKLFQLRAVEPHIDLMSIVESADDALLRVSLQLNLDDIFGVEWEVVSHRHPTARTGGQVVARSIFLL